MEAKGSLAFLSRHLFSISSYSRLYSGIVDFLKLASHANSKHFFTWKSWKYKLETGKETANYKIKIFFSPGKKTLFLPRSGSPVRPLYKLDLPMPGRCRYQPSIKECIGCIRCISGKRSIGSCSCTQEQLHAANQYPDEG